MTGAELIAHLQSIPGFEDVTVMVHDGHCCTGDLSALPPAVFYDLAHHTAYLIADMAGAFWDFELPAGTQRIDGGMGQPFTPNLAAPPAAMPVNIQPSMADGPNL